MATPLQSAAKSDTYVVSLRYGDPTDYQFKFFSTQSTPLSLAGNKYVGVPKMSGSLPESTGLFGEEKCAIELPTDTDAFLAALVSGYPASLVRMTVARLIGASPSLNTEESNSLAYVYAGDLDEAIANPSGRPNRVRLVGLSPLASRSMSQTVAIVSTQSCSHNLGGVGCYIDLASRFSNLVIESVDGRSVTTVGNPPVPWPDYFLEGYVDYEGIRVKILGWNGGREFLMSRYINPDWVGKTVKFFPGCQKTPENCVLWANLLNGGFYGFAIPSYNPLFELPSS